MAGGWTSCAQVYVTASTSSSLQRLITMSNCLRPMDYAAGLSREEGEGRGRGGGVGGELLTFQLNHKN